MPSPIPRRNHRLRFARFTCDSGLPRNFAGSASALPISGPAQRSLTLRPACSPSPLQNPLHQRLQPLRYLRDCSSCYRPERKLPGGIRTRWKTAPLHGARNQRVRIITEQCGGDGQRRAGNPFLSYRYDIFLGRKLDIALEIVVTLPRQRPEPVAWGRQIFPF